MKVRNIRPNDHRKHLTQMLDVKVLFTNYHMCVGQGRLHGAVVVYK